MACVLTTGHTLDCRDNTGGIKEIKLRIFSGATITASAGAVSAVTTTGWYTYQLRPEIAEFIETETENDANGTVFYEQVLNFSIHKMTTAMRNELRLLTQNRLLIAYQDRNGKYWLIGWNNGMTKSGSAQSGKAMGDMNGYNIKMTGKEETPLMEMSSAIYSSLTT